MIRCERRVAVRDSCAGSVCISGPSRSGPTASSIVSEHRTPRAQTDRRWTIARLLRGALYGILATAAPLSPADTPVYGYRVVREYPHDPSAFTQGLVYADGHLYESTGLKGTSSLRQVDL
ncbi:MAG: glutaminyl-peptide cyclotransferase, partial [Beggiatoa sp.]|nr:glutaminyl-peptide cyclotransferase [Beggiatoa sp.]